MMQTTLSRKAELEIARFCACYMAATHSTGELPDDASSLEAYAMRFGRLTCRLTMAEAREYLDLTPRQMFERLAKA